MNSIHYINIPFIIEYAFSFALLLCSWVKSVKHNHQMAISFHIQFSHSRFYDIKALVLATSPLALIPT